MSANTALVTDAAKAAATQSVNDFSAGVFAHITGDWNVHNPLLVYAAPYIDKGGNIVGLNTLRLLLTASTSDVSVALPITATGTSVLVNSPPLITVQPTDVTTPIGTSAAFSVTAISSSPLSYQWLKNGVPINGQTSPTLLIVAVTAADNGHYSVVVTSAYGSVTSRSAAMANS